MRFVLTNEDPTRWVNPALAHSISLVPHEQRRRRYRLLFWFGAEYGALSAAEFKSVPEAAAWLAEGYGIDLG